MVDGMFRHIDPRVVIADLKHVIDEGEALTKIAGRYSIECNLRKKGNLFKKDSPGFSAQQYLRNTTWMKEVEAVFRAAYPACKCEQLQCACICALGLLMLLSMLLPASGTIAATASECAAALSITARQSLATTATTAVCEHCGNHDTQLKLLDTSLTCR